MYLLKYAIPYTFVWKEFESYRVMQDFIASENLKEYMEYVSFNKQGECEMPVEKVNKIDFNKFSLSINGEKIDFNNNPYLTLFSSDKIITELNVGDFISEVFAMYIDNEVSNLISFLNSKIEEEHKKLNDLELPKGKLKDIVKIIQNIELPVVNVSKIKIGIVKNFECKYNDKIVNDFRFLPISDILDLRIPYTQIYIEKIEETNEYDIYCIENIFYSKDIAYMKLYHLIDGNIIYKKYDFKINKNNKSYIRSISNINRDEYINANNIEQLIRNKYPTEKAKENAEGYIDILKTDFESFLKERIEEIVKQGQSLNIENESPKEIKLHTPLSWKL